MGLVSIRGGLEDGRNWAAQLLDARLWRRQEAARHLAEHPHDARKATGALAVALADADSQVRRYAAQALSAVGSAALDVLLIALGRPKPATREQAAALIGQIGPPALRALPTLEAVAEADPSWEVRVAARDAMRRIHPNSFR